MCCDPIKILNPSKWLSPDAGQQLFLYVPCGHCVECRQKLQNEWRIRSYYESMETIKNGGYILFDTLTYSDLFLPRLNDFYDVPLDLNFSCFKSDDIQLFLKRLRKNLKSLGYNPENKLRYFITSEYGLNDRFTHRPHYHPLFFVKDSFVPPLVLSECISKSWKLGRTDGLPFKHRSYVLHHNLFKDMDIATKRCVMYVSKYVAKDFHYSGFVKERLFKLMDYHYPGFDWQMDKEKRNIYNLLCKFVAPFHRQSLGFGHSYYLGREKELLDAGYFTFNIDGIPFKFSLFPSLKRKLLYNRVRKDGVVSFVPNQRYVEYKMRHLDRCVLSLKSEINNYNYNNLFKIQFSPFDFVVNQNRLQQKKLYYENEIFEKIVSSASVHEYNGFRNYCALDRGFIHKPVLTKFDYGSKSSGFQALKKFRYCNKIEQVNEENFLPFEAFYRYCLFDSKIDAQYEKLLQYKKELGQKKFEKVRLLENNKRKLKKHCVL